MLTAGLLCAASMLALSVGSTSWVVYHAVRKLWKHKRRVGWRDIAALASYVALVVLNGIGLVAVVLSVQSHWS